MVSFALVAEGITDQIVLETILSGYYDEEDVEIKPLQPLRDATDKFRQGNSAGWELVFEFCSDQNRLAEALAFNDFLIIQIDTDCGEHPNYGVPLTMGGVDKPDDLLVNEVQSKINEKLGKGIVDLFSEKIIFAVCVHSLECWLLPLHARRSSSASRTKNCGEHLSRMVRRNDGNYSKDAYCYSILSKEYEKKKTLEEHRKKNRSFDLFVSSLPDISFLGTNQDAVGERRPPSFAD